MSGRTRLAEFIGVAFLAAFAAACGDSAGPINRSSGSPRFDVTWNSANGTLGASGNLIIKGFDGGNPRQGDAIVATFVWLGSTDIIDSVTDVETTTPFTPIGNTFHRVEYVTAGGISMATYVATNVKGVTDGYVHAVRADLSQSVTDGGVILSSWHGVYPTYGQAQGAHVSATGSGSTPTIAAPGSIPVAVGAFVYGVTLSNGLVGMDRPVGFVNLGTGSDASMVVDVDYLLSANAGSANPQWNWFFNAPSTWLATVFALNEAPTRLVFTTQPQTSPPCPATMAAVQVTAMDD